MHIQEALTICRSMQALCDEMTEADVRYYIRGDYDRADWNVVLCLTRINTAGWAAWNVHPIDRWILEHANAVAQPEHIPA